MYERKLSHNLKLKSTLVQLWKFCLPVMTHFYICCTRLFPAGGSALRDSTLTLMVVTFRQNKMHTFFIESISSSYERLLHSYEGFFFFLYAQLESQVSKFIQEILKRSSTTTLSYHLENVRREQFDGLIACPISGGSFLMPGVSECFVFINVLISCFNVALERFRIGTSVQCNAHKCYVSYS